YSPASRLMWNEAYVDVTRLPGFEANPSVRKIIASPEFTEGLAVCRRSRLVDYRAVATLKRRLMTELSASLTNLERTELDAFVEQRPEVAAYGRFRALSERHGAWPAWPSPPPVDFDPEVERYHRYAQWVAEKQVAELVAPDGEG